MMKQFGKTPSSEALMKEEPGITAMPVQALAMADRILRQDALLDQALLETFPASDPISAMIIT